MDKKELKNKLLENHKSFTQFVIGLTNDEFSKSNNEKWTAGQQLEHIFLSVKPVRQILSSPKFFLKLIWGQANRESKNYNDLVKKYQHKLENGGTATRRFIPKSVNVDRGQELTTKLTNEVEKLCAKLDKYSETELDEYILPHPLLGKLTLREMLFFTIYHVEHHEEVTKRNLK